MELDRATVYPLVVEKLQEAGHEASFYPDYSGRGMYGSTCPGIVTDAGAAMVGFLIACVCAGDEDTWLEDHTDLVPTRWDNMGLSMIFY